MPLQWVVVVAMGSVVAGWLAGWLQRRRLGARYLEDINRSELNGARLRGELNAALANTSEARSEAAAAQAALADALLERGRLHQRLEELRGSSVSVTDHRAALERQQELCAEVAGLQQQLALLSPVVEELAHYRDYVESLQRQLLYRDERVLALEAARPELPALPPVGAVVAVERPALSGEALFAHRGTGGATRPAAPGSAGQRGHGAGEQPLVEEALERTAGDL